MRGLNKIALNFCLTSKLLVPIWYYVFIKKRGPLSLSFFRPRFTYRFLLFSFKRKRVLERKQNSQNWSFIPVHHKHKKVIVIYLNQFFFTCVILSHKNTCVFAYINSVDIRTLKKLLRKPSNVLSFSVIVSFALSGLINS